MATSEIIASMYSNVANAYSAVSDMGGTIPSAKNIYNLASAVRTIPTGGGDDIAPQIVMKTITSYNDTAGAVKFVGNSTFQYCSKLSSVTLPNCSNISNSGFFQCSSLQYVDIPNCTIIGGSAFSGCSNLTQINMPNVAHIETCAFYGCSSLSNLDLNMCSFVGASAFYGTKFYSINLNNCYTVNASAFAYCTNLSVLNLPNVGYIYSQCFIGMSNLEYAYLPALGILSQGNHFGGQDIKLKSVIIGNIGSSTFNGCTALESVYILNMVPFANPSTTFVNTPMLDSSYLGYYGSIYVPSNAVSIYQASANWSSLSDRIVALPSEFESQFVYHSEFTRNYTMSEIPSYKLNAKMVGTYCFLQCSSLTGSYNFPECTTIGTYAFASCSKLNGITASKCTIVGANAFSSCQQLQTVDLQNCLLIQRNAFADCYNISTVNMSNLRRFNDSCFYMCTRLERIDVPYCQNIGNGVFQYCSKLSCVNLTSVSYVPTCGTNVFVNTPIRYSSYLGYYGSIYVPSSLYSDFIVATNWASLSARITSEPVPV